MAYLRQIASVNKFKAFFLRLVDNYSKRFVTLLCCVYLFLKGFVSSSVGLCQLPFLKNYLKVNEATYQIYNLIAYTPWSIKAFIGSVSDLYPLFGYNKKWYMLLSSVVGCSALLLLGVFPFHVGCLLLVPFLLFLVMMQISVIDLLCEAKYAGEMKTKMNSQGGDVVSFVWGCVITGSFVASAFVGVFTDFFNARYVYLICFPFAVTVVYPIYKNFMNESFVSLEDRKFYAEKYKQNSKLFKLAFSMAFFAIGLAFVNLFASQTVVLVYAVSVSLLLCFFATLCQERSKAKCNIYLFLLEATYIQIPGALDYWYTGDSTCVVGGPDFDMTYYLTYTNIVGALSSIVGIVIYQVKMSKWSFRSAFMVSSFIRIAASFCDIFIVSRLNVRVGIPDKVAYLFGDSLILNTATMLASMPAVMLTANIVSDGLESTTYAILAGFQNFGAGVSKSIGVAMMSYFGINADVRPCNFDNLSALIFVCHFLFPLIPILLVRYLIDETNSQEYKKFNGGNARDDKVDSRLSGSREVFLGKYQNVVGVLSDIIKDDELSKDTDDTDGVESSDFSAADSGTEE